MWYSCFEAMDKTIFVRVNKYTIILKLYICCDYTYDIALYLTITLPLIIQKWKYEYSRPERIHV